MKNIRVLLFLSLVIFVGCNKNTITSPRDPSLSTGQVSLQIDKTNAPQNVITVVAFLSRPGYDTLKGSLNLLSNSSADILIQNIPAGQWHLTVDALNDSSTVVYSGQTDVTITDGFTTQVSLTLMPTGSGTGNIYIKVNWGSSLPIFIDNPSNPVFTVYQNPSNPRQVSEAKILFDNGTYKMWYLCGYPGKANIWYAESSDGIDWVNKSNGPVVDVGSDTSWDSFTTGGGSILKDGNLYRMYFNGVNYAYGKSQVGYAVSSDGINWQKYPEPVLKADSTIEYHIGNESVLKINNEYFMYYQSSPVWNYDQCVINLATSTDGIHWTKYSNNPILTPTFSWEGIGITYPNVIYDGTNFIMIYITIDSKYYGEAVSTDGIHWTKKYNKPIFSTASNRPTIDYPNLIKVGNEYRIYYTGTGMDGKLNISFVQAFNL